MTFSRALLVAICLVTGPGALLAAEPEVHGADSVFAAWGLAIVWGVLADPIEDRSVVVTRISNPARRYAYLSVEGVDPFTGRRALIVDGLRIASHLDVRSPRPSFAELPRREIHLYGNLEDWRARRPALTVYYLGVPDTTPEFASEDRLSTYLATASSERRLIR